MQQRLVSTTALVLGAMAAPAFAGTLTANYDSFTNLAAVGVAYNLPGGAGTQTVNATLFHATRTDLPAGPGVDTYVPAQYNAFCVEIGETINQGVHTYPNVFPLLGATTNTGGISGPVAFDATRTLNLETFWGTFFPLASTDAAHTVAFQLGVWELAFDTNLSLAPSATGFWSNDSLVGPGAAAIAEGWLTQLSTNTGLSAPQPLYLLTGAGIQDHITTPTPGSFMLAAAGGLVMFRRRR